MKALTMMRLFVPRILVLAIVASLFIGSKREHCAMPAQSQDVLYLTIDNQRYLARKHIPNFVSLLVSHDYAI